MCLSYIIIPIKLLPLFDDDLNLKGVSFVSYHVWKNCLFGKEQRVPVPVQQVQVWLWGGGNVI